MFCAWMWIQTFWATRPVSHIDGAILFTKYSLLCVVIYQLLQTEGSLSWFVWGHVLGCFLWSWIAYTTQVHGRFELVLEPSVDDSNMIGFHLTTGLAMAGFLFLTSKGLKRLVAFAVVPFILNGIILTASRSAILGLTAAAVAALLLVPRQRRVVAMGCGILGVVLLLMLAQDELFWSRAATIKVTEQAEMDASAASRLIVAEANWRMFLDHPFGAGHRGNDALSPLYMPTELMTNGKYGAERGAHNTFLGILVDEGLPGALLFGGLMFWAAAKLWQLRSLDTRGLPPTLGGLRAALGAGLAAYIVSGIFVNLIRVEVALWLVAMLAVLSAQCERWASGPRETAMTPEPAIAPAAGLRSLPSVRDVRPRPQPPRPVAGSRI